MSHKIQLTGRSAWSPSGPKSYAHAARKFNISPTPLTTFFVRDGTLKRFLPGGHAFGSPVEARAPNQGLLQKVETLLHKHTHTTGTSDASSGTTSDSATDPEDANEGQDEMEVSAADVSADLEYVVPVTVGSQTLTLDFDTGSSDLWVLSTSSGLSATQAAEHTLFNPSAATKTSSTWNISYGDGSSASGIVYNSPVTVGTITIPSQAVEVATKVSASFASSGSDGLLGLAWPSINTVSPKAVATPVENMINENLLAQPLFTVKLEHDSNASSTGAEQDGSFYTFGYVDNTVALTSGFTTVPVDNSNGFWEFPTVGISIDGTTTARSTTAIADTGTTLLLVDDATVKLIYSKIKGATMSRSSGGYIFPTTATLPKSIGFEVGGTYIEIPGTDLAFSDAGNGHSFGAVQSRGQNAQDIWGDVFLKRVYAVFNQGATTIAFASRTT